MVWSVPSTCIKRWSFAGLLTITILLYCHNQTLSSWDFEIIDAHDLCDFLDFLAILIHVLFLKVR